MHSLLIISKIPSSKHKQYSKSCVKYCLSLVEVMNNFLLSQSKDTSFTIMHVKVATRTKILLKSRKSVKFLTYWQHTSDLRTRSRHSFRRFITENLCDFFHHFILIISADLYREANVSLKFAWYRKLVFCTHPCACHNAVYCHINQIFWILHYHLIWTADSSQTLNNTTFRVAVYSCTPLHPTS